MIKRMTLILCECGRYFNKYGNIVLGNPEKEKVCWFRCPHCKKDYWENAETRSITRRINGDE